MLPFQAADPDVLSARVQTAGLRDVTIEAGGGRFPARLSAGINIAIGTV